MSWSFTVNDEIQSFEIPESLFAEFEQENLDYGPDMALALQLAKDLGLKTATLTGYRTPSPYGGPDAIGVSVMGTIEASDWFGYVKANIEAGPDAGQSS